MKTKLKANKLKEVKFAEYQKEFLRLARMVPFEAPSAEKQLWFFVKHKHTFACGKEHPLILICKRGPLWLKVAKDSIKESKKFTLVGKAHFHRLPSDQGTLQITPKKGTAKLDKISKEAKSLLKKAKLQLQLAKGAQEVDERIITSREEEEHKDLSREEKVQKAKELRARIAGLLKKLNIQIG